MNLIKQKKSDFKEYVFYDSTYMKSKEKQNYDQSQDKHDLSLVRW